MNWFAALRPAARVSRELKLIRLAMTRLADAAERLSPPPLVLPDPPEPPAELANSPTDFGRLFEVEQSLAKQLGHAPDPEEIWRAYEGEAEVLRGRRRESVKE